MHKTILSISLSVLIISLVSPIFLLYTQSEPVLFKSHINRPWPSPPTPEDDEEVVVVKKKITQTVAVGKIIPQEELWQALVTYRATHNRDPLTQEDSLCTYARSRVTEHQARLQNLSDGESPLDNHAGFQRDAESEVIFSQTGFATVAEVLAYLPNAKSGIQVMEWGWDTSPAHREGLLSNDLTHACVVGTAPFYVGILGKR